MIVEAPSARDRIAFNHERLKITLLDGLHRRPQSPAIPAGCYSPEVSHVLAELSRGVPEPALARILGACGVDLTAVIESLRDLQLIEEIDSSEPLVPESLRAAGGDRLTWLGHACILLQTSRSAVCVDPFLRR